jgi:hypothetical protein
MKPNLKEYKEDQLKLNSSNNLVKFTFENNFHRSGEFTLNLGKRVKFRLITLLNGQEIDLLDLVKLSNSSNQITNNHIISVELQDILCCLV